jgi:hypothetical protein
MSAPASPADTLLGGARPAGLLRAFTKWSGVSILSLLVATVLLEQLQIHEADVDVTVDGEGGLAIVSACSGGRERPVLRAAPLSALNFNALSAEERVRLPELSGGGLHFQGLRVPGPATARLWIEPTVIWIALEGTDERELVMQLDGEVQENGEAKKYRRQSKEFLLPTGRPAVLTPVGSVADLFEKGFCVNDVAERPPLNAGGKQWRLANLRVRFPEFEGVEAKLSGSRASWRPQTFRGVLSAVSVQPNGGVRLQMTGRIAGLSTAEGKSLMPTRLDQLRLFLKSKPVEVVKALRNLFSGKSEAQRGAGQNRSTTPSMPTAERRGA